MDEILTVRNSVVFNRNASGLFIVSLIQAFFKKPRVPIIKNAVIKYTISNTLIKSKMEIFRILSLSKKMKSTSDLQSHDRNDNTI